MKPRVFVNAIDKNIKNNMEVFHFKKNDEIEMIDESVNINEVRSKIKEIFDSTSFVYKSKVNILLKDGNHIIEDIIAIKDNDLITLNGNKININNILDIKKAN